MDLSQQNLKLRNVLLGPCPPHYFELSDAPELGRRGEVVPGCIVIAINLTIIFAEIVNFFPNDYVHTFAPPSAP